MCFFYFRCKHILLVLVVVFVLHLNACVYENNKIMSEQRAWWNSKKTCEPHIWTKNVRNIFPHPSSSRIHSNNVRTRTVGKSGKCSLLNCKIPVAMDQSRKSGKFIMLNQAIRLKKEIRMNVGIAEAKKHCHYIRTTLVVFLGLLLLKSEHDTIQFAMNAIEWSNRKHMRNNFNATQLHYSTNISNSEVEYSNLQWFRSETTLFLQQPHQKTAPCCSTSNVNNKFIKHAINSKCFSFEMEMPNPSTSVLVYLRFPLQWRQVAKGSGR